MNVKQIGEAFATIPEPYASEPWDEISFSVYKDATLVVCSPHHRPIAYGTNVGWRDIEMNTIEVTDAYPVEVKDDR